MSKICEQADYRYQPGSYGVCKRCGLEKPVIAKRHSTSPFAKEEAAALTTEQQIKKWDAISDPKEALKVIVANETFFGYDPYYSDLREALVRMAERVSQ